MKTLHRITQVPHVAIDALGRGATCNNCGAVETSPAGEAVAGFVVRVVRFARRHWSCGASAHQRALIDGRVVEMPATAELAVQDAKTGAWQRIAELSQVEIHFDEADVVAMPRAPQLAPLVAVTGTAAVLMATTDESEVVQ